MKKIYNKPEIKISCVSLEDIMVGSDVIIDVDDLFNGSTAE